MSGRPIFLRALSNAWFQPDDATIEEWDGCVSIEEVADVGIQVNGVPWGWAWNEADSVWYLLPCNFYERSTEVFSFGASFEMSMTGGAVGFGCQTLDGVTVASHWDDIEGVQWVDVQYGGDPNRVASSTASNAFWVWEPSPACPVCLEDQGWLISIEIDQSMGLELVGDAMTGSWRPCADHVPVAANGFDLLGCLAKWVDDRWALALSANDHS